MLEEMSSVYPGTDASAFPTYVLAGSRQTAEHGTKVLRWSAGRTYYCAAQTLVARRSDEMRLKPLDVR